MEKQALLHLLKDKITLLIILIIAFATVALSVLPNSAASNMIANITGLLSVLLATIFALRAFKLYGMTMAEGKAWFLFSIGLVLCTVGVICQTIFERTGIEPLNYGLAVLRTIAYGFFVTGFAIKLHFAGIKLTEGGITITFMFIITWVLLVLFISAWPGLIENTDYNIIQITYPIFSLAEIFILFVILLILQMDVTAKGWIPISIGMFMVSIGDTFYTIMRSYVDAHGGYYDGHPYHLIWYIGLFIIAYGAYYQWKIHKELIAL